MKAAAADVYTDFNGLAQLKAQAKSNSPAAVREVAKQFESIFITNVLKGMRDAKLADGALDSDQSKFYGEMYDQQMAVHLSGSSGVGLTDLIVKQLGKGDNAKDDAAKKLELEDFLNRSSGTFKTVPNHIRAHVERPRLLTGESDPADLQALKTQSEFLLKKSGDGPITSAREFVRQLQPYAEQAGRELGVDPKVLLAQAALETGWGKSLLKTGKGDSSFNLFNIKTDRSWQGKQLQVSALEFDQGFARQVKSGFRAYDSYRESFRDYVRFIKDNPRYSDALKQAGNAENYLRELQQAGYATDPKYADKILGIYRSDLLAQPAVITEAQSPQSAGV